MLRQARFQVENGMKPEKFLSYTAVLDMLFHISSFSKVLTASDPLEIIGSEHERSALIELKNVVSSMVNGSSGEIVNLKQFFDKLATCSFSEFGKNDNIDIITAWDDIVKLIMMVIPPLREVFLGHLDSAQEVPEWINLSSRCFRAHYSSSLHSLEDIMRTCCKVYTSQQQQQPQPPSGSKKESVVTSNVMVLMRCPEILVVSVESGHLKNNHMGNLMSSDKAPSFITFPDQFDLSHIYPEFVASRNSKEFSMHHNHRNNNNNSNNNSNNNRHTTHSHPDDDNEDNDDDEDDDDDDDIRSRYVYDLTAVSVVEGANFLNSNSFFRLQNAHNSGQDRWYRGAGNFLEEVVISRVFEGNYFSSGQPAEKRVHPRLLIYMRRDLPHMLERTIQLVTKGGQMRALGDVAYALAMTTTDNFSEARRCYEEAIALDSSLKDALQDNLLSLEKMEWTQKARALEEQGDLALANNRYREANDNYTKSLMSAVFGSPEFVRVKQKVELVARIISLESSCHFAEKGEDALKSGSFSNAKEHYNQVSKLNNDLIHVQILLQSIEKTIQLQIVKQKTHDANQAMKAFKYRQAHQLLLEAIAIAPEERYGLQSILDDLGPLIQCENALARQRAGVSAIEEKRYSAAVTLFTEAITLLPDNTPDDHAYILCDRASAYYEMKEMEKALEDCNRALVLKPDYAMAHFRLGTIYFHYENYDEASACYDKALRYDANMQEQVKIKMRQLNTAKEVQERKERETERVRQQEEQKKLLEEKRARDELIKKEKAEKLALEQAEKAEQRRLKEEAKKLKAEKEKEAMEEANRLKELEKEKQRLEKLERDAQRAAEREKQKLDKEKERERMKAEKERKAIEAQKAKEEERIRQLELQAEKERLAKEKEEAKKKKEEEDRIREEEEEKEKKRKALEKKKEAELRRKQKEQEEKEAVASASATAAVTTTTTATATTIVSSLHSASSSTGNIMDSNTTVQQESIPSMKLSKSARNSDSNLYEKDTPSDEITNTSSTIETAKTSKKSGKQIKILSRNASNTATSAALGTNQSLWAATVAATDSSSSFSAATSLANVIKIESQQDFPPLSSTGATAVSSSTTSSTITIPLAPTPPPVAVTTANTTTTTNLKINTSSSSSSSTIPTPLAILSPNTMPTSSSNLGTIGRIDSNKVDPMTSTTSSIHLGIDLDLVSVISPNSRMDDPLPSVSTLGGATVDQFMGFFEASDGMSKTPIGEGISDSSHFGVIGGSSLGGLPQPPNLSRNTSFVYDIFNDPNVTRTIGLNPPGAINPPNTLNAPSNIIGKSNPMNNSTKLLDTFLQGDELNYSKDSEFQPSAALLQHAENQRLAKMKPTSPIPYYNLQQASLDPLLGNSFHTSMLPPTPSSSSSILQSPISSSSSTKLPANTTIGYNRDKVNMIPNGGSGSGSSNNMNMNVFNASSSSRMNTPGMSLNNNGGNGNNNMSNSMFAGLYMQNANMNDFLLQQQQQQQQVQMMRSQQMNGLDNSSNNNNNTYPSSSIFSSGGGNKSILNDVSNGNSGLDHESILSSLGLSSSGLKPMGSMGSSALNEDSIFYSDMNTTLIPDGTSSSSTTGVSGYPNPSKLGEVDDPISRVLGALADSTLSSPDRSQSKSFDVGTMQMNSMNLFNTNNNNPLINRTGSQGNTNNTLGNISSIAYNRSQTISSGYPSTSPGLNSNNTNNFMNWGNTDMTSSSPTSPSSTNKQLYQRSTSAPGSSSILGQNFGQGLGQNLGLSRMLRDNNNSSLGFPTGNGTNNATSSASSASIFGMNNNMNNSNNLGLMNNNTGLNPPPIHTTTATGIDGDIVLDNLFPNVVWLRQYDMNMYRWAGNSTDWTEYALHVPPFIENHLFGPEHVNIHEISRLTGCPMRKEMEYLRGKHESFIVFNRGPSGHPSNIAMNTALEYISQYLSQKPSQQVLMSDIAMNYLRQMAQMNSTNNLMSSNSNTNTQNTSLNNSLLGGGIDYSSLLSSLTKPPGNAAMTMGGNWGLPQQQQQQTTVVVGGGSSTSGLSNSGWTSEENTTTTPSSLLSTPSASLNTGTSMNMYPVNKLVDLPYEVLLKLTPPKLNELSVQTNVKLQYKGGKGPDGRTHVFEMMGMPDNIDRMIHALYEHARFS